jgi:hypothetical protein
VQALLDRDCTTGQVEKVLVANFLRAFGLLRPA